MYIDRLNEDLKKWYKPSLCEATDTGGSGSFKIPLSPGTRLWDKNVLEPFTKQVSKYDDAMLAYDSYDGKMSLPKNKINKIEKTAKSLERKLKKNPQLNDDDGDNLNQTPGKNLKYVPVVNEWIEITPDTIIENLNVKTNKEGLIYKKIRNIILKELRKQ
jgi:hypothetical protein